MSRIQNDGLQILGIVLSLIGLATIAQPLIKALFGHPLTYAFLGILPEGWPSFAVWAVTLVTGLVLVSITKPLKQDKKNKGEGV
ncbi:hypothetical protein FHS18_005913 [Paenibacillus phyllosphaerae]|uniref:Uncharacterized protein n=1 Tax=Paenibacillus phyllosphaerae TaxID=274593 RepID=A0A7W5FQT4_9BACL|nr:hypothetical protein [Paenibacillus phyllosphaerae]MBB3113800.1 hypothetical protein [Paenibacillus phyllosphaerae]